MARSLGPTLPPDLLAALSQSDLPQQLGRALPLVTVDAAGRPHPMLCSYLELLAVGPRTIRVAIFAAGQSAANLEARAAATLLMIERGRTVYIKCRAAGPALRLRELARFDLTVEDVLEDSAAATEGDVRITGGITYGPPQDLDSPWARATLAALRSDG